MHSYSGAPPEHQPTSREKNYPLNHCLDSLSSESCCFQPVSSSLRKENLFTGTLESLQISGSSVLLYCHGPLPAPIAVILSSKASPNLNPDPFSSNAANSGLRPARPVSPLSPGLLGKVPRASHTSSMEPSLTLPDFHRKADGVCQPGFRSLHFCSSHTASGRFLRLPELSLQLWQSC